ncbi:MAG: aspartate kinase [Balneolaceae bacterium]|nr:aspartate kinase [Balneolaceae bacterium]
MAKYTVLKFGGTSMGDEHTWKRVLDITARYERPWVVVSATARTTRRLIAAAESAATDPVKARDMAEEIDARHRKLITGFMDEYAVDGPSSSREKEQEACLGHLDRLSEILLGHLDAIREAGSLDDRTRDAVASIGERLSSRLLASCARAAGMQAQWVDARELIRTDDRFGGASPDLPFIRSAVSELLERWRGKAIPVMGGYYGQTANGNLTNLGFEGSDYTASLIGASLPCEAVEIWTDVSGVYTCDPRVVEGARPIPALSFREATELAWFGAKVLHPSTLKPASARNLTVRVKNIFEPEAPGTRITGDTTSDGLVKAMAYKERSALDDGPELKRLSEELQELGEAGLRRGVGVIGLVGCDPARQKELVERLRRALGDIKLETLSYSSTKRNLNLVVEAGHTVEAVRRLHEELFEG